jgi:hypothetical protein
VRDIRTNFWMREKECDVARDSDELPLKSQLDIFDRPDGGITNLDKPSTLDARSPTWDFSSRCAGRHTPEVEMVVRMLQTEAGSMMLDEVKLPEIDDFVEGIKIGIRRHVKGAHIAFTNKVFGDNIRGVGCVNARCRRWEGRVARCGRKLGSNKVF